MNLEDISLASVRDVDPGLLGNFSCGDPELEQFLAADAVGYDQHGVTATTVVFVNGDSAPAGFFSLSADGIKLSDSEVFELAIPFHTPVAFFPAVKITKLATRADLQSSGLGALVMQLIQGLVFSDNISVRLLTVNAVSRERTLAFYEREGFLPSLGARQGGSRTVLMYLDLFANR